MASLEEHLRHPTVSIEDHIEQRGADFARALDGKTAIYLDVRFWVIVREVRNGTRTSSIDRKFVHHLEALVGRERGFCPITTATFNELMKQGNLAQRLETARVIDELSCGVSLLPEEDRMASEVEAFILSTLPPGLPIRVRATWTGLCFVLGHLYPTQTAFGAADERAVQKAVFDELWDRPLVQIAEAIDPEAYLSLGREEAIAEMLNAGNAAHRAEMKSFDAVVEEEFHGVAEICAPFVERAFLKQTAAAAMLTPLGGESERLRLWANVIRESLKLPEKAPRLPTAHLHAAIHALLRWEYRDKTILANDIHDFSHAVAALGYCQALFTERELSQTMRHQRMKLDQLHGCFVTNSVEQATGHLRSLRS